LTQINNRVAYITGGSSGIVKNKIMVIPGLLGWPDFIVKTWKADTIQ